MLVTSYLVTTAQNGVTLAVRPAKDAHSFALALLLSAGREIHLDRADPSRPLRQSRAEPWAHHLERHDPPGGGEYPLLVSGRLALAVRSVFPLRSYLGG